MLLTTKNKLTNHQIQIVTKKKKMMKTRPESRTEIGVLIKMGQMYIKIKASN
jgi:2C-methyl-D-erythritol 2,4-cyclodiphosphate synthase